MLYMKLQISQVPRFNIFWIILSTIIIASLSGCENIETELPKQVNQAGNQQVNKKTINCSDRKQPLHLEFLKTNNRGDRDDRGINHVIIFNPKSPKLDFKVNVSLKHPLYAKNQRGKYRREYQARRFYELVKNDDAKLNGKTAIAAINADYIDTEDKPQGFNVSRGTEYSGAFRNRRSSFAISGGKAQQRIATIQLGRRKNPTLNYNAVGGNGRFYRRGRFINICNKLGKFACEQAKNRSMVAITTKGYVIFLVNDIKANSDIQLSSLNQELLKETDHCNDHQCSQGRPR